MKHNHITRDIKKYGECPGCDSIYDFKVKDIPPADDMPECTGLLFRSRVSTYFDGKKMGERKTMNLLKRKSCRCPKCDFIKDELKRFEFDYTYSWLKEIEDDELYTIEPTYDHAGDSYEYGGGDIYMSDFKFVKVKK